MQVRPNSAITAPPAGREPVPTAVPKPAMSPSAESSAVGTRSFISAGVVAVSPREQLAQLTQIVVGSAHADRELGHPRGRQFVGDLADAVMEADHVLDGGRVAADPGAVLDQHLSLVTVGLRAGERMPHG